MLIERIALAVAGVWLLGLSVVFAVLLSHYNRLAGDLGKTGLKKTLEKLLERTKAGEKELAAFEKKFDGFVKASETHLRKVGLVRFNPFGEMGGDQSFSLVMLDGLGTGFVLTGLHTREKTRIYVKSINKGKSRLALSKEEKRALEKALK